MSCPWVVSKFKGKLKNLNWIPTSTLVWVEGEKEKRNPQKQFPSTKNVLFFFIGNWEADLFSSLTEILQSKIYAKILSN